MISKLLVASFAVLGASAAALNARQATVALGEQCSTDAQCPSGSSCYAVNAMQITRCGNFQASCTTDANCAFNACNAGFCNGAEKSSVVSQPPAPTITADPHVLGLGALCSADIQCISGVQCWSSNVMVPRVCGGFNAVCSFDAQCANDVTCVNGLCSGPQTSTGTWTGRNTKTSAPSSYTTSATQTPVAPPVTTASPYSAINPTSWTPVPTTPSYISAINPTSWTPVPTSCSTLSSSYIGGVKPTGWVPIPTGKGNGTYPGGSGSGYGSGPGTSNGTTTPRPTPAPYTGAAATTIASSIAIFGAALVFAIGL